MRLSLWCDKSSEEATIKGYRQGGGGGSNLQLNGSLTLPSKGSSALHVHSANRVQYYIVPLRNNLCPGLYIATVPISGVVGPMSLLYKCLASVIRLYITTACANICHYSVSCWENEIVLEHCIEALQGKMTVF